MRDTPDLVPVVSPEGGHPARAPAGVSPEEEARVRQLLGELASDATKRAYRAALRRWRAWAERSGRVAFPAEPMAIADYLDARAVVPVLVEGDPRSWAAPLRPVSLAKHLSALRWLHRAAGHPDPAAAEVVRLQLRKVKREDGTGRQDYKRGVTLGQLARMVKACPQGLVGYRDRALLLFGFYSARRRSELAALEVGNLEWDDEGVRFLLERSKTDQEAAGKWYRLRYSSRPYDCPVVALRRWLEEAAIEEGRVFRALDNGQLRAELSARGVSRILQRAATRAGLDASKLGAHSLRRGFVTEGKRAGADVDEIMAQTGHRSARMVREYIDQEALDTTAADVLLGR